MDNALHYNKADTKTEKFTFGVQALKRYMHRLMRFITYFARIFFGIMRLSTCGKVTNTD